MSRIVRTANVADGGEPPFAIDIDVAQRFVRLTLVGMWTLAIVDAYVDALTQAFKDAATAGAAPGALRTLVDLRRHGIQQRDVAQEIEARLAQGAAQVQRLAVLVSGSALHAMQARRAGSLIQARVFVDEGEALAWLTA